MSVLWSLFATFFKIGLFTFGGGYAMIPLLQAELVEKRSGSAMKKSWTIIRSASARRGLLRSMLPLLSVIK